jgi:hypothetical protein
MYGTEIIQCHSSISEPRCEQVVRLKLPPHGTISFNDFLLAHSSPSAIQGPGEKQVPHPSIASVANMQQGKVIKAFLEAVKQNERTPTGKLHITRLGFTLLPQQIHTRLEYDEGLKTTAAVFEYYSGKSNESPPFPFDSATFFSKMLNDLVKQAMTNDIGRRYLGVSSTSHPAAPTLTVEVKDLQRKLPWKDEQGSKRAHPEQRRPPFFRLWFEVCDKQLALDAKAAHETEFLTPLYLIIPINDLSLDAGMGVLSTNTVEGAINSLLSDGMASVRTGGMKKKKKTRKRRRRKKRRKTKRRMRP